MKLSTIVVLLALSAGIAHAQPSGAQAETLFRQGKDLMAKGQTAEACAAFDASQKLEPRLATLTITVPPENRVGGLQIQRGGEVVDPGAWNKALPVDGGTYKIT